MRFEGGTSAATAGIAASANASAQRAREAPRHAPSHGAFRDPAPPHDDEPLSRVWFLRELRREKLRADRFQASLSLVVFRVHPHDDGAAPFDVGQLLDVLHGGTRETDIVGYLDHERVAVLCPDTDAAGALELSRKVAKALETPSCTSECATYPAALFDDLTQGRLVVAHNQPFVEADRRRGYATKRLFDIVGAGLMLALLSPLMILVAIGIKLTSPGPAIFEQKRLGRGGTPFKFYKFRSMVDHVDDRIHRSYIEHYIKEDAEAAKARDGSAKYKLGAADPRITRIGRFIRKTSIDELPQLFNVLRGDMSLVGPRPPIPYETNHYQAWHLRRITSMKPGLTGLWQVEGRGRVKFNEMVRLDLKYIRECSLALDVKIMARTVLVVLRGVGAG